MSTKRSHKYFVNQRHKQRLESKVYAHSSYWSHVKFVTKEPDPRHERDNPYRFLYYEKGLSVEMQDRGRDTYTYYERPEVPYSIMRYPTPSDYSKRRKYLCKQANKRVRRQSKQFEELYQHSRYKRVYNVSWNLD